MKDQILSGEEMRIKPHYRIYRKYLNRQARANSVDNR